MQNPVILGDKQTTVLENKLSQHKELSSAKSSQPKTIATSDFLLWYLTLVQKRKKRKFPNFKDGTRLNNL